MSLLLAIAAAAAPVPAATPQAPVEVMVLGTYHMNNPGRDIHNARIAPVTTPARQAELKAVADALARFRPTVVALEKIAPDQATLVDDGYARFTPADLARDSDERVQIGYRLASLAGVTRVYAVNAMRDFPYPAVQAWAEAHGRTADLAAINEAPAAAAAQLTADQGRKSVARLLREQNMITRDGGPMSQGATYYGLLRFGAGEDQPGAVLNGEWYTRNAMIFAKLAAVAKPGDRIVLLFGSGHAYWLRHFVATTPGYRLVDPLDWLPKA